MRKLFAIFKFAWGRTPMPRPWGTSNSNINYVLRCVGRIPTPKWRGWRNIIVSILIYILWPLRAPLLIWRYTMKYGAIAKEHGAPSIFNQILDQLKLSFVDRVSPELYYRYRLFECGRIAYAKQFLQPNVYSSLFKLINKGDEAMLDDKLAVEKKLSANEIPSITTHAVANGGRVEFLDLEKAQLLKTDMIVKPNDGKLGKDVYYIEYLGEAIYKIDNNIFGEFEVIEFLETISQQCTFLIQPCLQNHNSIKSLAPKSVSTVRMVTGLWPSERLDNVYAVIKIPAHEKITDNFSTGGLAAAVDMKTGRVGKGVAIDILARSVSKAPISGAQIEGLILPDWEKVVGVGIQAHRLFPDFVFLGWDIAITNEGLKILETNVIMGLELIQTPELCPLGSTIFTDIANEWI